VPEAEEFPLLEALLVETSAWGTLSGCCSELQLWRLAVALILLVFTSECIKGQ
jgi:hypothetical protein